MIDETAFQKKIFDAAFKELIEVTGYEVLENAFRVDISESHAGHDDGPPVCTVVVTDTGFYEITWEGDHETIGESLVLDMANDHARKKGYGS
jgi:hypothetical protein